MNAADSFQFNPEDLAYTANPYPAYRYLREHAPAYWWQAGSAWVFSRYDDVVAILRDGRFSLDFQDSAQAAGNPAPQTSEFGRLRAKALFTLPPAEHTRVRKLVGRAFTPRAVEWVRASVQASVDANLRKARDSATFDLARDFAESIPLGTISTVLGIPPEQEAAFRRFGDAVSEGAKPGRMTPDERTRIIAQTAEGFELLRATIAERRRQPQTDVLSALIESGDQGDRLDDDEIIALVMAVIAAGTETTRHLICFAMLTLLRHPEQLALLQQEPSLMRNALDETLRYDAFPKNGVARFALQDVELRGVTIKKGQMVFPLLSSAMRDPEAFLDPDRFDLRRDQSANVSYGTGAHHCVGAPLARLQGEVAVGTLLARYPAMALAGEPVFVGHPLIRKMASLPVRLA